MCFLAKYLCYLHFCKREKGNLLKLTHAWPILAAGTNSILSYPKSWQEGQWERWHAFPSACSLCDLGEFLALTVAGFLIWGNQIVPKSDSPGCVKAPHLDTRWTILSDTRLAAVSVFKVQTQRWSLRWAPRVWSFEHPWLGRSCDGAGLLALLPGNPRCRDQSGSTLPSLGSTSARTDEKTCLACEEAGRRDTPLLWNYPAASQAATFGVREGSGTSWSLAPGREVE